MKRRFLTVVVLWGFTFPLFAEPKAPQLMDLLGDDPSLLLEPSDLTSDDETESDKKPASEREISAAPKVEEKISEPQPEVISEPEKLEVQSLLPPVPVISKPEPATIVAVPEPVPAPVPAPAPKVEPVIASLPTPAPASEPTLPPAPSKPNSELTVVSGVNDISIIFSNKEFYPSQIRMKKTSKTRLIFTTTEKKPAALVFEKQKITRWLASESASLGPEYRELNPSKISEIRFDAEPGVYRFYDAISGASGEIEVE